MHNQPDGAAFDVVLVLHVVCVVAGLVTVSTAAATARRLGRLVRTSVPLPETLRRYRLGSRLIAMAEAEARRRGCTRITLNTLEIQAQGFYLKQGFETAASLTCAPPGFNRYVMTKKLT